MIFGKRVPGQARMMECVNASFMLAYVGSTITPNESRWQNFGSTALLFAHLATLAGLLATSKQIWEPYVQKQERPCF